MIRVKGGLTGLTSFRWFFVGPIPERVEGKDNNTLTAAESVMLPLVMNGIIDRPLDQDCFRFTAKAGEKPVIAVMSHWLDALGQGRENMGFADLSLDILDASGRVVAQASDTLGYDPLIHFEVPADGEYIARVSGMGFKGFPTAVYRLTMGEVPYPIAVFPAGGQRGQVTEVEFFGPNVPPGTRQAITVDDDPFGVQYVSLAGDMAGVHELPFIRSDLPQQTASGEATGREKAELVSLPATIDGRFDTVGVDFWSRLRLTKGQSVTLAIMAQQRLRAPIDTLIEVYDEAGAQVASNDDGELFGSECSHDFVTFDSRLEFTAKAAGEYTVRVAEQSGTFGKRAIFRLSMFETTPDFRLYQWPDALPVWGAGSTSAFVVETHRLGGLQEDIEVSVEGLSEGWTGSVNYSLNSEYRVPQRALGQKTLLTITAPPDAPAGAVTEFQVVGRAKVGDREIVRRAESLTLHMWQEPNHFRLSPISRAVVAPPQALQIHAETTELFAKAGEKISIPIRITTSAGAMPESLRVSVNRGMSHFQCAFGPQVSL
ncbi:MAG: pre-peptidase C-terminal domain-containing protein, partial [Rhodopirellula sp.]|nr:pre-peptidase C-terminal domain-containing protein [Rhodopirellula sp.]